jgi:hypothetical protein
MAIRNLSHLISLLALRAEIIFTLDQVKAHPLTQGYVPVFEGLRDDWNATFGEELALRDGLSAASARITSSDEALNSLASRVSKAVLTVTGDDKKHPLYVAFFKKKALGVFKRPVLGEQLDAMRGWIEPLTTSDVPALAELGPEVEAAVAAADQAVATRGALETQSVFFREAGGRKRLFDKVNAVRKSTHGELAKMPHENAGLPASFAGLFFRHESGKGEEGAPTLESVDEEIAALEAELAEKRELRARLQAETDRAAHEEAERAARQAAIAELQEAAAEAEQKAAEARARIAALSK